MVMLKAARVWIAPSCPASAEPAALSITISAALRSKVPVVPVKQALSARPTRIRKSEVSVSVVTALFVTTIRVPTGTASNKLLSAGAPGVVTGAVGLKTRLPPPSLAMLLLKSFRIMPRRSTVVPGVPLPTTSSSTRSGVILRNLLITTMGAPAGGAGSILVTETSVVPLS